MRKPTVHQLEMSYLVNMNQNYSTVGIDCQKEHR